MTSRSCASWRRRSPARARDPKPVSLPGHNPAPLSPPRDPMPILPPLHPTKGAVARHRAAGCGGGFREASPLRARSFGGRAFGRPLVRDEQPRRPKHPRAEAGRREICAASTSRHRHSTSARGFGPRATRLRASPFGGIDAKPRGSGRSGLLVRGAGDHPHRTHPSSWAAEGRPGSIIGRCPALGWIPACAAMRLVQDDGGLCGDNTAVFPGLRAAKSPEPRTETGPRKKRSVAGFATQRIGSGFRAQACSLPRNDSGGSAECACCPPLNAPVRRRNRRFRSAPASSARPGRGRARPWPSLRSARRAGSCRRAPGGAS